MGIMIIPRPIKLEEAESKESFDASAFIRSVRQCAHDPERIIKLCELAESKIEQ